MKQDVQPSATADYRMLGLLPTAPRELVEEVYWHLSHQTRKEAYSHHAIERLSALNLAYDRIAHTYGNGARANGAHTNGAREKRGLFSRRATKSAASVNLYELLHLHPEAGADVVGVAVSVMLPHAPADTQLREQIERARDVLVNPARRAAYDKKIGVARMRAKAAIDVDPEAPGPGDCAGTEATATAGDVASTGDDGSADDAGSSSRDGAEREAGIDQPDVTDTLATPEADAAAPDGSPDGRVASLGLKLASWFSRNEPTPEMIEAENGRVLSLADEGEVWNVPEAEPASADLAPAASGAHAEPLTKKRGREVVLSFEKGPRAGEAITPDGANEMRADLGGPGGDVQIRVWRGAGVYLLQQLIGPPVLVGGAHIEALVVVLEDGDEIASGEHVLRFTSPE